MEEIVFRGKNDQAVTSSLLVAEKFEKSHDNVLKAIRKILDDGIVKNDETPMFVVNVNDGCDKEIETLLSKQDCIELMAYLSAATFALRD